MSTRGGSQQVVARSDPAREDQRERLMGATVRIVARDGYADATIGDLAASAGVSRATFYELFENKEACTLAAQRTLGAALTEALRVAIEHAHSARGAHAALAALLEFAQRDALAFDFLTHETMLVGPSARGERDRLLMDLAEMVERSWARAPEDSPIVDVSATMLIDGAVRLLDLHAQRHDDPPQALLNELLAWVDSYTVTPRAPRWRALIPNPAMMHGAVARPAASATAPRSLPRGRHRMGPEVVRSVQRERIAFATAEAMHAKGYANMTVADIVATAGVSRDVFYVHFHDKEEAFDATVQLLFEQLLATMAGAFFGQPGAWPDQLWEAGLAFAGYLEENPVMARFLSVGTYAPPSRVERVHDFVLAFALFVEAGNSLRPASAPVPRAVTEAIVCSVLETVSFHVRHDLTLELRGLVPNITYMVFAPFMGADEATQYVDRRVAEVEA